MTFSELIGLIIALMAFFILTSKRTREPPPDDQETAEQEESEVDGIPLELPLKKEESFQEVSTQPSVSSPSTVQAKDWGQKLRKKNFIDPYAKKEPYQEKKHRCARVKKLVKETHFLREFIVIKEILDPPKGL